MARLRLVCSSLGGNEDRRHGSVTVYLSSGNMDSFRGTPSSSRIGSSSWRYSAYWVLFSTLNLIPVWSVSYQGVLSDC
jgi:hypothetical protein